MNTIDVIPQMILPGKAPCVQIPIGCLNAFLNVIMGLEVRHVRVV